MTHEPLIIAAISDFAGKMRGKAFPASQLEKRLRRGVGWTPTNVQITCFDTIANSPYGSSGDLVLIPDMQTHVNLEAVDNKTQEQFVLGNIMETNGTPWECCTRSILQAALERLKQLTGLSLYGAFEHEFHFSPPSCPPGSAYSTAGFRSQRQFGESLFAAMQSAGLKPDTFMKEYGADQYEATLAPAEGLAVADQAAILRELVHITAERLNTRASFTPLKNSAGVGNGVHIHLSFRDSAGKPATYDANDRQGLSKVTQHFIAGILKYLDRIIALTAPSVISYARLAPHKWSAAFNNLGVRDREAAVRICPFSDLSDIARESQFNFEFRAADAAASPYLALAALVHAGCQGIDSQLECPVATKEDLSLLSVQELEAQGYIRLPQSLEHALKLFSSDETVVGWFPPAFANIYVQHKQEEISCLRDKSSAEIYAAYEDVY